MSGLPYVYSWVIKHFKAGVYNENSNTSLSMLMLTGTTIREIYFLWRDILASAWSEACCFCSSNQLNLQWHLRNPGCCLTLHLVPGCSKVLWYLKAFTIAIRKWQPFSKHVIFPMCVWYSAYFFPASYLPLMSWNKAKYEATNLVLCVLGAITTPAFVKIPPMINLASSH